MGKKRIYELAKEINKSSKDVVDKAQALGMDVKNHMGSLTGDDEKKLRQAFDNKAVQKQYSQSTQKPSQKPVNQIKPEHQNTQQNKKSRNYQEQKRGQGSGQVNSRKKSNTKQSRENNPK
jgi:translation initiation factor IF-2